MDSETVPSRDSATHRPETWFFRSAAVLLILTALAKGFSALGSNTILEKPDPVFWVLKNRELLVLVGGVEMTVAGLLLSSMPVKVRRGGLLWLCANFLLYRAGLWMTGSAPSMQVHGRPGGPSRSHRCPSLGDHAGHPRIPARWLAVLPVAIPIPADAQRVLRAFPGRP